MAIENAKLLNVRIKNKYDSYENWASSGLILEPGEIAIAHTSVDVKVDNGTAKHPALLMKVGDGEKTFANLPWLSAKAADVLSVCKNETELTAFVNSVIADAGIASDEAMEALAGRVTTAEGAIDALEVLVGTDKVADQIAAAIAALNLDTTYEKVGVAKGLVDALADGAVKDNADAIAAINHEETGVLAQAKAHADGLDSAMDARVDVLETQLRGVPKGSSVIKVAKDVVYSEYISSIDQSLSGFYKNINENREHIQAIELDYLKAADKTELSNAITLKADKTALNEVSAVANAAVKQADYDVKVAALEAEDARIAGLVAAEEARALGIEGGLETRLAAVEKDYLKAADKTELQGNIDTLTGVVETLRDGLDAEKVDGVVDLVNYVEEHGAEVTEMKNGIAANKKAIEDHVATDHDFASADAALKLELEGKIALKADASVVTAMDTAYKAADTEIKGRLDVLEAIEHDAYIAADTALENKLNAEIAKKADKTTVEALDDRVEALEGKDHEHANFDLLETYTQTEANLADAVAKRHAHENASVLDGISAEKVAAWDAAEAAAKKYVDDMKISETYATKDELNTAKTDLTTEINKKANDADLAAIAKSGSTDDLVQGTMTLVFDCGTSAI